MNIEKLSSHHNLLYFDSGQGDLNEFLKENSLEQMKAMVNVTHLCLLDHKIIAFFTISADRIETEKIPAEYEQKLIEKGIEYKSLPALKLGRLAVDYRFQNQGYGTYLLKELILKCIQLSENIGIRFITVDAYVSSLKFYKMNYFKILPGYEKRISQKNSKTATIPMYFDLYGVK